MEKWQSWKEGGRGRTELIYVQEGLEQKRCVDGGDGEENAEGVWRGIMNSFPGRLFYLFES